MSVQSALRFVHLAREDADVRVELEELGEAASLEDCAALAADLGLDFTGDDLLTAFQHDWRMRWVHYRRREPDER